MSIYYVDFVVHGARVGKQEKAVTIMRFGVRCVVVTEKLSYFLLFLTITMITRSKLDNYMGKPLSFSCVHPKYEI